MANHDELPLPDYDHLPVGSLASRVRTLDLDGVRTLLDYERGHGNRLPVVTVLQNRVTQLEQGAQPSGGDPAAVTPEAPAGTAAGSKVSTATSGPPVNPPSQGDPTNPAQPR
jgi:hypothetical protein